MNKKTTTDIMYAKSKMSETRAETSPNGKAKVNHFQMSLSHFQAKPFFLMVLYFYLRSKS